MASLPTRPGCALVSVGICVYLHVSLLRYDLVCVHVTSLFLVGFIFVFSLVGKWGYVWVGGVFTNSFGK